MLSEKLWITWYVWAKAGTLKNTIVKSSVVRIRVAAAETRLKYKVAFQWFGRIALSSQ